MEIEQSHGPTHQSPPDGSNRDPCHGVGGTACRPTTRQGDFRRRNPQFTAQTRPVRQLCEGLHRGRGPAAGDRSDVAGDAAQPEPQLGSPRGARVHRAAFGPCRDPAGLERTLQRRHQPAPGRADADRAPVAPVGPRHRYLDAPGEPARPRPHGAGDSFVDLHAPGDGRQGADVPGRDRRPGLAAQDQALVGTPLPFPRAAQLPPGCGGLRGPAATAGGGRMRGRRRMGCQHSQPAAARPERTAPETPPRTLARRPAPAMRANPVALIVLLAAPVAAEPVRIDISTESVIGLSGIEVSADGTGFLAISDRGWFVEGTLQREGGVLVGGEVTSIAPILGMDGQPVAARRVGDWSDAEGLAVEPDGTIWVSFERWMRVARYDRVAAPATFIRDHPTFRDYPDNRQLEALTLDAEGRPVAIPEAPLDGVVPVYRLDPGGWEIVATLVPTDGYSVVGAATAGDDTIYLLERKLVLATWFRSRLSRVEADWSIVPLWESDHGTFGNLEGVSVWEAPEGRRAVMVSDNNGREGIPTEVVEIGLTE